MMAHPARYSFSFTIILGCTAAMPVQVQPAKLTPEQLRMGAILCPNKGLADEDPMS
jgi:hypothetical protein